MWGLGAPTPHFSLEGHERGVNAIDYYPGGDRPYLLSGKHVVPDPPPFDGCANGGASLAPWPVLYTPPARIDTSCLEAGFSFFQECFADGSVTSGNPSALSKQQGKPRNNGGEALAHPGFCMFLTAVVYYGSVNEFRFSFFTDFHGPVLSRLLFLCCFVEQAPTTARLRSGTTRPRRACRLSRGTATTCRPCCSTSASPSSSPLERMAPSASGGWSTFFRSCLGYCGTFEEKSGTKHVVKEGVYSAR